MNDQSATFAGELSKVPVIKLFYRLTVAQQTGKLDIVSKEGKKYIYFKNGSVNGVESEIPTESISTFLAEKRGNLKGEIARIEELSKKGGGRFDELILSQGLISANDYFSVIIELARLRIINALHWKEGQYRFYANIGPDPAIPPIKLSVFPLLASGVRETVDEKVAAAIFAQIKRTKAQKINNPMVSLSDMNLTAKELRIYSLVLEYSSIEDAMHNIVMKDKSITPQEIIQVVFLLWQVDLLALTPAVEHKEDNATSEAARQPHAAAVSPPKPKQPTANANSITLESLDERAKSAETQNFFEILSVERNATESQIKSAYLQLARVFHPDNVRSKLGADKLQIAEDYFERISEAYQILSNKDQRDEYLAKLKLKEEGPPAAQKEFKVEDVLESEQLFLMAKKLLSGNSFAAAEANLTRALALSPDEKEYKGYLAWAMYNNAGNDYKKKDEAKKTLKEVIDSDIEIAEFFYYLGYIFKIEGNLDEAENYFVKTLQIDGRHIKAKQEIHLIQLRKQKQSEAKKKS
ncbi:MAG: hypothetical protein Kow0090_12040 [Myxococcota bacterium]